MTSRDVFKHFFLLIHKIVPLSGRKNYTYPISCTKIYPIARFLTLPLFSLVSFHQELVSFILLDIFEHFFSLIHKIDPLSGGENLFTSNQRYGNLSNCKVPDLTTVFVGLLSSRIGKFLNFFFFLLDIAFLPPVRGVTTITM